MSSSIFLGWPWRHSLAHVMPAPSPSCSLSQLSSIWLLCSRPSGTLRSGSWSTSRWTPSCHVVLVLDEHHVQLLDHRPGQWDWAWVGRHGQWGHPWPSCSSPCYTRSSSRRGTPGSWLGGSPPSSLDGFVSSSGYSSYLSGLQIKGWSCRSSPR